MLAHAKEHDEVVLWFGATPICQLSLIQLLAWLGERGRIKQGLSLVSAYGGWLRLEQLLQAYAARQPVTSAQKRLGGRAWLAFCSPSPVALSRLLTTDLRPLPELRDTMSFMLQEYPERHSGLSRLEQKTAANSPIFRSHRASICRWQHVPTYRDGWRRVLV